MDVIKALAGFKGVTSAFWGLFALGTWTFFCTSWFEGLDGKVQSSVVLAAIVSSFLAFTGPVNLGIELLKKRRSVTVAEAKAKKDTAAAAERVAQAIGDLVRDYKDEVGVALAFALKAGKPAIWLPYPSPSVDAVQRSGLFDKAEGWPPSDVQDWLYTFGRAGAQPRCFGVGRVLWAALTLDGSPLAGVLQKLLPTPQGEHSEDSPSQGGAGTPPSS